MTAHRFFWPWLLCLWVFLFAEGALARSNPAFWRVAGKQGSVYLLGSMHFGHPSFFPLPPVIEHAFNRSAVLAVEVDITRINPDRAERALMKYGQLPEGETLRSRLDPDIYQQLTAICTEKGIPLTALDRFQPWFAALQLVLSEIHASPLEQTLGLDLYFLKRASAHRVDEIESFEEQLKLSASASPAAQNALLGQTLRDLENSQSYLMTLASAWRKGDLAALEESLVQPFRSDPGSKSLYQQMFIDRNRTMTGAVESYLRSGETVFFVVGAGHLVGADGIIALLGGRGYSVERLN